jgi:hypothetical protein
MKRRLDLQDLTGVRGLKRLGAELEIEHDSQHPALLQLLDDAPASRIHLAP